MIPLRQHLFSLASIVPPPPPIWLPFDPTDFRRHGPRDYQLEMLLELVWLIQQGYRKILLQLPTGGGKTMLATALLASASEAYFVVHRDELIKQTSRAFAGAGIEHSFIASGRPYDPEADVLLAGIATLANMLGVVLPPQIVIWDEAHHLNAATWARVMAEYPDALHIGLTATPQRLDGRGLGEHFQVMVLGPSTRTLIERGFLSDFDYYAPPPPDEDDGALVGNVVEHYLRYASGEPGIVFAANVERSKLLEAAFQAVGVSAMHIDGGMSQKLRDRFDDGLRSGDITVGISVNLVGEGYDVPAVRYCGIDRRTDSLSWFLQMVGRVLRVLYAKGMVLRTNAQRLAAIAAGPKPRAIICDHGNNWFRHGMPDDERPWTLEGRLTGRGRAASDATPIHQCMTCYQITPSTVKICPGCGTPFPSQTRNIRFKEGTLTKIDREEAKRLRELERRKAAALRKAQERECKSHADFVALHKARGYNGDSNRWAKMKVSFRNNYGGG